MSIVKPLPVWPFLIVDAFFLGLAWVILSNGHHPLTWQEAGLLVVCGVCGGWSFLMPFLRRSEDEQKLSQFQLLTEATAKIQKLDDVAGRIQRATQQWTELHTHTAEATEATRLISEKMSVEAKGFTEFLQRANDTEKGHLRLEVEKLRRAEGERVSIITHILDHVFALHLAASQSGQPALAEQIGQFQNVCRDAARRIGLIQIMAPEGETFDTKLHQLPEGVAEAAGKVGRTLAPGYSYQGQAIRRPLVGLQASIDTNK